MKEPQTMPPAHLPVRRMNALDRRQALKATLAVAAAAMGSDRLTVHAAATQAVTGTEETLYVNPATGVDANVGTKEKPLKSLTEAARRVNAGGGTGAATIVLAEGAYAVGESTVLKPERRTFSKTARLTIRAEVLPDDPDWNTGRMPTLIHTLPIPPTWNRRPDPLGGAANGFQVETSHVTIQGLKILGTPVVETPKPGMKRRLYAIARLSRDFEDLEVAQCLFVSDEFVAPNHVGIIANGNGLIVRNCIFRGYMKDPVVFWTPGSTGHAMRNCLFHGTYGSTVWTSGIAGDFEYRNNVVDSCNYVWIYQSGASARTDATGGRAQLPGQAAAEQRQHYKVVNSLFANNKKLAGNGTGARIEFADIDPSFLDMAGTTVTTQAVQFELDMAKRSYLHPISGSDAAKIGAGLFTK